MSGTTASGPTAYARAEPVPLDQAEKVLDALWREAGQDGEGHGLARACLWNLVVMQRPGGAEAEEKALRELLDAVAPSMPSRVIRLQGRPGEEQSPEGKEVTCWVSALCNVLPSGAKQISAEEIRLVGYGARSDYHFPALVRAFLLPDLPIALMWQATLPRKGRLLRQFLGLSHRILVDTQAGGAESALTAMHELVAETHADFVDLGWMRLNPVRYLLAGMFDAPGQSELLGRVQGLRVEATPLGRNTGLLMLGWILSRLGQATFKADESGASSTQNRWRVRLGEQRFPVEFAEREGEGGRDGLLAVEIQAGGETFALRQVDRLHVVLESPLRKERKLALHGWSDPELVVAALGGPGVDPLYAEALAVAARLIDAEAWTR